MNISEIKNIIDKLAETHPEKQLELVLTNSEQPSVGILNVSIDCNNEKILVFPEKLISLANRSILMTLDEAAKFAGGELKAYRIGALTRQKGFYPAVRIGKRVYIHREKFKQWLDEQATLKKVS